MGSSLTTIGASAFKGCVNLTNLIIPDAVTSIGNQSFGGVNSSLFGETITSKLTNVIVKLRTPLSVNANIFNNGNIGNIDLRVPVGTQSLYQSAEVWKNFKTITEKDGLSKIFTANGINYAVNNSSKKTVEVYVNTSYNGSNLSVPNTVIDTDTAIQYTVTSIGSSAFEGCTSITTLTIPNSLTNIAENAFSNCIFLTTINSKPAVPISINANVFNNITIENIDLNVPVGTQSLYEAAEVWKDFKTITEDESLSVQFITNGINYIVTNTVNKTVAVAKNNSYVGAAVIPNSVVDASSGIEYTVNSISNSAFLGNNNLTEITLPVSVTTIGENAFSGCVGLASIILPETITSIGNNAFVSCTNLSSISVKMLSPVIIEANVFTGVNIENINLNVPVGTKSLYEAAEVWKNFKSIKEDDSISPQFIVDGIKYIITDSVNHNVKVGSNTSFVGAAIIPSKVTNSDTFLEYSITSIGENAFMGSNGLKSITIGSLITTIGKNAFKNSGLIGEIIIPNIITSIGEAAFSGCVDLTSIKIPESITNIEPYTFEGCTGLTNIVLPKALVTLKDFSFSSCTGLTSVSVKMEAPISINAAVFSNLNIAEIELKIPFATKTLYETAPVWKDFKSITEDLELSESFTVDNINYVVINSSNKTVTVGNNTSYIGAVVIPNKVINPDNEIEYTVTTIGDFAFVGNNGLTALTIGSSITSIGIGAFYLSGLSGELTLPNTVTSIGEAAFSECSGLTSINIPDAITSIEPYTFYGCSSIKSLEIPNSVTSIGSYAFVETTDLITLTLGNSLISIGDGAFYKSGVSGELSLPNTVTSIGEAAFSECSSLTSIDIPDGVKDIRAYTFYNCNSLTSINIPDSVISIGKSAFVHTVNLQSLSIGNSLTSIGYGAFYLSGLSGELILPNTVTSIGEAAFSECSGLTSINIPDAVTSIGAYTFYNCNSLTTIAIPNLTTSIGTNAFTLCTSLTSVSVKNTTPVIINPTVFSNISLENIILKVPLGSKVLYDEATVWKDFKSVEEDENLSIKFTVDGINYIIINTATNLVSVGDNTTYEGVTVSIPETVTDPSTDISYKVIGISKNAFKDNTHIAYLKIAATVVLESIGESAFSGCTAFSGALSLPASVTSIGAHAFSGCVGITSVSVRNSIPVSIQANVFEGLSLSTIPLNVPNAAAKTAYEGTSVWSDFKTISVPGFTVGGLVYTIVDPINYTVEVGDNSSFADSFLSILDSVTDPNTGTDQGDGIDDGGLGGDDGFGGGFGDGGYDDGLGDGGDLVDEGGSGITYNVIGISKNAFKNNTNITYLDITTAASLVSIGEGAFSGCSEMTGTLSLPSLVTNIGAFAFDGCTKLSGDLLLPSKVTSIDESAFKNCTGVTSVTVKNPIPVSIQANVFEGLTLSNIPLNVFNGTAIAAYATAAVWKDFSPIIAPKFTFEGIAYNVTDLTNKTVELGDNISYTGTTFSLPATVSDGQTTYNVTSIAKDAFKQNSTITTVDLSGATNLTIIGQESFTGCTNLTTVTLPEGLTHIEDFAFGGASALTSIVIPNSVTSLGNAVFTSCSSLTSAVVGNLVTELKSSVFNNCSSLVTVTLGSSVTSIGTYSFSGCTSLKNVIVKNTTPIADLAASVFNALTLDAITLKVPNIASKELYELTSVWEDFRICVSFTANSLDFNITDETNNTVELGYNSLHNGSVVIPATVIFDGIVYKVTAIANDAFKDNTDITSIDLSGATNLRSIGNSAFRNSTNLQTVVIPSTVTSIGDYAFADTTNLEVVVFSEQTSDNSSAKISYQNQANKIVVANSLTSIGAFAFSSSGLTSITIPGTVTSIGERAFKNCNELETVIVENSNPIDISDNNVFEGVILNNVSLIVPNDIAIATYQNTAVWQDFKSIREESTLDIEENVFHKEISLKITENQVEIVHSATIKVNRITVITTLGSLFITIDDSDKINTVSLLRGVYLIKIDTSNGSLVKKFIKL
ncbi:hypothetical protein GGR97_000031 [Wenyingzhuangia aestuarii]|nr:leucine-rich repeat protein [Wenyingzhuangia aestuarii]NJB81272.1 hypothetical protein [Wenyingzhuangia aestuarii]